jgi:predicted  nucleic acid-binding Zn-ribbon protein
MQDEIDRLRALVGPDERSYAEVVAELATASEDAREREAELGALRARVLLLERALGRAERRNAGLATVQRVVRGLRRRVRRLFGRGDG